MSHALYENHEVILDNEYATLIFYPDQKMVHHKCHKPVSGNSFRQLMETGAGVLETRGAVKWLSDDRANSSLPKEDMDWANVNWHPRVVRAGWKFWALVVPEELIARFTMTRAVDSGFAGGVRVMAFVDPEEAKNWLEEF